MVLLRNLEQFAKVEVWKPERYHAQSSSFYLVAKEVQVGHAVAGQVVEKWKGVWRRATFGGEEGVGGEGEEVGGEWVQRALEVYGPRLVELGGPVWAIQARGLGKATYIQPREGLGKGKDEGEEGGSRLAMGGAVGEKRFPRYTGGLTWLSKRTKGEDKEVGGALGENQPTGASSASWRA